MQERLNQLLFLILNPATPPFVRLWVSEVVWGDREARWLPAYLFPMLVGLTCGSMPHRKRDTA